jgi:diguanylate cyclase (GGDEF)-like protein
MASQPAGDESNRSLSQTLEAIETLWLTGVCPKELPGTADDQHRLSRLMENLRAMQEFTVALSRGDLAHSLKIKGLTAGSLKALQSNLRHLTWQAQMIAQGDFSQRVDFMGDFSEAFNSMVRSLAEARTLLEARAMELSKANDQLRTQLLEIQRLQAELREQAIRDPLTNLYNRRHMQETFEREIASAHRHGRTVAVIMMDIDHFKNLNDTHGHKAGDLMLQALADLLQRETRGYDVPCRYGGEEFVVVLSGATIDTAQRRAERLRSHFAELRLDFFGTVLQATVSAGVAVFPPHGETTDALLRAADQALYAAKSAGRNRVVLFGS